MGERRKVARYGWDGPVVFPATGLVPTEGGLHAIRDISPAGISVVLERALEPDNQVPIELYNHRGQFWHRKIVRVVHATEESGQWVVGGTFVEEFTWEKFRALVG